MRMPSSIIVIIFARSDSSDNTAARIKIPITGIVLKTNKPKNPVAKNKTIAKIHWLIEFLLSIVTK